MKKELSPLEALDYLTDMAYGRKTEYEAYDLEVLIRDYLKALEIIKEKNINVGLIMRVTLLSYNTIFVTENWKRLTKKEYCLLMKVLL